jgi:hypothetical protein
VTARYTYSLPVSPLSRRSFEELQGATNRLDQMRKSSSYIADSDVAIGATKVRRVDAQIRQFWRFARDLTGMGCGCPVSSGATEVELPGFL